LQPLDLDFFLGNHVHVLADVRHEVFDHLACPFDLETQRYRFAD
jgi:hypothetical protein